MKRLIHRNEPNRPHISSVTINFKERRNKINRCAAKLPARPPHLPLFVLPTQPVRRLGEGVSTVRRRASQDVISTNPIFFCNPGFPGEI
ncbi:MAG: hypothetical protein ACC646_05160 [Paracoccaceae bacterium]